MSLDTATNPTSPLRTLLVEDSEEDAELILSELSRSGFQPSWIRTETAEGLMAALTSQTWDVVLSDFTLPRLNAAIALEMVRKAARDLPFIVVSGTIGEELAVGLMRSGANDYILKSHLRRLAAAVRRELQEAEHRRARHRAEQINLQLAAVVQSSLDPIISHTLAGIVSSWNVAAERLYGWTATEMVGQSIAQTVPGDRLDELAQIVERLQRGDALHRLETVRMHRDGSRIDVLVTVSPIYDQHGRLSGVSKIIRDDRERKRSEAERARIQDLLQLQIARMPLAYLLTDAEFRIIDWNAAAEQMFGYTKDEMLGLRPPFEKIVPQSWWSEGEALLRRLRAGEMAAHATNDNLTKAGSTIRCAWSNTPLFSADGVFTGLMSLAQEAHSPQP
ncbi:MAG: PAS domain S-box protein [Thermoanaerobaculia bacterium]